MAVVKRVENVLCKVRLGFFHLLSCFYTLDKPQIKYLPIIYRALSLIIAFFCMTCKIKDLLPNK